MPLKFLKNNQPWVSEVKQNSLSRGLAAGTPGAGLSRRGPGRSDEGSGLCPVTVSAMCVQRRGSLQGHTGAVTKQSRWSAATPPGWARTARPTSGCVASCGHEACGGQQVTGVRNASSTVAEAGGGEALAGGSVEAAGGGGPRGLCSHGWGPLGAGQGDSHLCLSLQAVSDTVHSTQWPLGGGPTQLVPTGAGRHSFPYRGPKKGDTNRKGDSD